MNYIDNANKFFEIVSEIIVEEMMFTDKVESKVYAFVEDKDGDNHVTMKELPDKDFENGDLFKVIAETAMLIAGFRQTMNNDGYKERAIFHLEVFRNAGVDNKTIIVFVKIDIVNGEAVMREKCVSELVGGETIVDENGNLKTSKMKLVPSEFLNEN